MLTLLSSPHVSKLMVRVGVNILRPPATRARECKEMHAQKERSLPPCARRKKLNSGDGRNPRNAHAHSFDSVHLHKTAVDNWWTVTAVTTCYRLLVVVINTHLGNSLGKFMQKCSVRECANVLRKPCQPWTILFLPLPFFPCEKCIHCASLCCR